MGDLTASGVAFRSLEKHLHTSTVDLSTTPANIRLTQMGIQLQTIESATEEAYLQARQIPLNLR